MAFTRKIDFEAGYDYVVQPTKKHGREYGRHGLQIRFLLEGKKGVVQFLMYTHWLPLIKEGFIWKPTYKMNNIEPMAVDIGYHSYKPHYKGQSKMDCTFLKGSKYCYYDGSGLYSEQFMAELFNKGSEALWKKMEQYYKEVFNPAK